MKKGIKNYEEQIMLNKMKTVKKLAYELNLVVADNQRST